MTAAKSMYFDSTPILGIDTEIKQPIPQGDYDGGHPGLSHNNLTEPSTHLPKEHHLFLDHAIAAQDPIYALYPIFRFTASSAKQAMSMITQQYEIISSTRWDRSLWRTHLDQLVLQKHILDDHVCQHQAALRFWTSSDHEHWTKTLTTDQAKTATKAKDSISDDYEYLIQRCRALSDHHSTAINILTATASLAEAEESIQVAKQVTKLTVLATIFLPLSFCASIFGMNFRELNNLSIWIWIVVTVVTGIATLVTYRWSDRHLVSTAVKKKWNEYSKPSGVQTRFSSSAKFSGV